MDRRSKCSRRRGKTPLGESMAMEMAHGIKRVEYFENISANGRMKLKCLAMFCLKTVPCTLPDCLAILRMTVSYMPPFHTNVNFCLIWLIPRSSSIFPRYSISLQKGFSQDMKASTAITSLLHTPSTKEAVFTFAVTRQALSKNDRWPRGFFG